MKLILACASMFVLVTSTRIVGQLVDKNKAPNTANEGISRPLTGAPYPSQIGDGRTGADANASQSVIVQDPFRAIRRGRQLFQRKFTRLEGQGTAMGDGFGNIDVDLAIGAGLSDSCAGCHGRPRGSAGFGGDVVTRPDSRDAPHLFGLGLKEMLADEITADLRALRTAAVAQASRRGSPVTRRLMSKGISYGVIRALPDGSVDTSGVEGVDADLRVRPFFYHGGMFSIREFIVGALKNELGLAMAHDPDLATAQSGGAAMTATGMILNGLTDTFEPLPADEGDIGTVEQRTALVDFLEFYLFSYFKAGTGEQTLDVRQGASCSRKRAAPHVTFRTCASSAIGASRMWRPYSIRSTATSIGCSRPRGYSSRTRHRSGRRASRKFRRTSHSWSGTSTPTSSGTTWLGLPRTQLRWDAAHRVPDDSALGRGKHAAVWARRPQHQPDGSHPPPWRRGEGGA